MRLFATTTGLYPTPAAEARRSWLKRLATLLGGSLLAGRAAQAGPRQTQASEPFLGEIMIFAGNFAPQGWAFCNGQILSISQNAALYSLLGTTYGGNGTTTFGLPNLQGRLPMHAGNGPGLTPRVLGQAGGEENVTLQYFQMPTHAHTVSTTIATTSAAGNTADPTGHLLANDGRGGPQYSTGFATGSLGGSGSSTTGLAGGGQPHDNMPPFLCLNFCIALEGIYPPRP